MLTVHNHYTKKNSSISEFSDFIINNFALRKQQYMGKDGFVSMTNSISDTGDCLTITINWADQDARGRLKGESDQLGLTDVLNEYCIQNVIIPTKTVIVV
jgi:hypothetical protein